MRLSQTLGNVLVNQPSSFTSFVPTPYSVLSHSWWKKPFCGHDEHAVDLAPRDTVFRQKTAAPLEVIASTHWLFRAQILIFSKTGCHLTLVRRSSNPRIVPRPRGWLTRLGDQGHQNENEGVPAPTTLPFMASNPVPLDDLDKYARMFLRLWVNSFIADLGCGFSLQAKFTGRASIVNFSSCIAECPNTARCSTTARVSLLKSFSGKVHDNKSPCGTRTVQAHVRCGFFCSRE